MGMSFRATTSMSLSSSMIQPVRDWPDLTPSTTTTPTPSPSSCTTKWIIPLFYSQGWLTTAKISACMHDRLAAVLLADRAVGGERRRWLGAHPVVEYGEAG